MIKGYGRREFLKSGLLSVPVLSLQSSSLKGGEVRASSNYGPKIKISLNAFSFNDQLKKHLAGEPGGLSLFDVLDYCARIGFDAIDPTGYYFPGYPERPDRAYISKFKRHAHRLGLGISGTGIRNDFASADKSVRRAGLELTKLWVDVASELGAPVLRVFAGHQPKGVDWETAAGWVVDSLKECAEYGEQAGVIIAVQNHAHMIKTADQTIEILDRVDSEWVGLVADTGSFITENPYDDIERVIPYAVNWQLKDLLTSRKGGPIDVKRFTRLLIEQNYRGYVPIEALPGPEGRENFNPSKQVAELYSQFRKAITELS